MNSPEKDHPYIEEFIEEENNYVRMSPEKYLLDALLRRAISDLKEIDSKLRLDASEWFTDEEGQEEWGSYSHVCTHLEIADPLRLRERIFRMAEDHLSSININIRGFSVDGVQSLPGKLRTYST